MALHEFSKQLKEETKETIKYFGTYDFNDKGPSQLMNIDNLIDAFSPLTLAEKCKVAKDIKKDEVTNIVLSTILEYASERKKISDEDLREVVFSGHETLQKPFNSDFLNNTLKYQSWKK